MALSTISVLISKGPKFVARVDASMSTCDQSASIRRFLMAIIATGKAERFIAGPGSLSDPLGLPGINHDLFLRNVSTIHGRRTLIVQYSKLIFTVVVSVGCVRAFSRT